jgi:hypothetical protein
LEREMNWWHKETDERGPPQWAIPDELFKGKEQYELRPTGVPVACNGLWQFVWDLEEAVEKLSETQKPVAILEAKR